MDRDGHDFHALFQYMFYTWVKIAPISSHSIKGGDLRHDHVLIKVNIFSVKRK